MTEHFDRAEFACRCGCGYADVNPRLVEQLERLRTALGVPVHVLCGVRCPSHNDEVGGAARSQHLQGNAADITVVGLTAEQLAKFAEDYFTGIGVYARRNFVHVDVRPVRARWKG